MMLPLLAFLGVIGIVGTSMARFIKGQDRTWELTRQARARTTNTCGECYRYRAHRLWRNGFWQTDRWCGFTGHGRDLPDGRWPGTFPGDVGLEPSVPACEQFEPKLVKGVALGAQDSH